MEPVPYGTEEKLAEYLHRQLLNLEKEISLLNALKKPLKNTFTYALDVPIIDADPGAGVFRIDNANWALATNLFFNNVATNDKNPLDKIRALKRNDEIILEDVVTPGNKIKYRMTNLTMVAGYFKIAILSVVSATGAKPGVITNFNVRFIQH